MKKVILFVLVAVPFFSAAQNVGIGTLSPLQKLHVNGGNFLIQEALAQTSSSPTGGQTTTMVNSSSIVLPTADSTNKIYDPGGAAGNYLANLSGGIYVPASTNCVGFEVTINSIGLGTGDSLVISELSLWRNVQLAVGNNYSATGTHTFNTPTLYFTFKSNSDASVGAGFDITIKRKYRSATGTTVQNMAGNVFLYDSRFNRLQMGNYKNINELGEGTFTSGTSKNYGFNSFAYGNNNQVFGSSSLAFGSNNEIYGEHSAAIGLSNIIYTNTSFALGWGLYDYGSGSVFSDHSVLLGKWNTIGSLPFAEQPVLVIGGGSPGFRSNAMEVYGNGFAYHKGYVQIGENAPLIKNALITGYTMPATDNSWVFIPVPADITDVNKIVSFQVIVTNGSWQYIPNSTHPGSYFRASTDQRNIAVGTFSGQSANLYGKPIKVFITYSF